LSLLDLITRMIFGEEYKAWSSLLCSLVHCRKQECALCVEQCCCNMFRPVGQTAEHCSCRTFELRTILRGVEVANAILVTESSWDYLYAIPGSVALSAAGT
jgi:hypothetical protein